MLIPRQCVHQLLHVHHVHVHIHSQQIKFAASNSLDPFLFKQSSYHHILLHFIHLPHCSSSATVNRFDGEFQPNLLSANSTTPRSLKQRGSKSTGALPTPMSPQAMLNLGHNVASRYDRSGIERTISDHKKVPCALQCQRNFL